MDIPVRTGVEYRELAPPYYPEFYGIILPITAGLGITGNIICALVFFTKHMRSSSTTYLIALAFADSLYLLCACLFYSPRPITWLSTNKDPDFEYPYPQLVVRSEPVLAVAGVLTLMYTVCVVVDHYTFVFKAKKYIKWTHVHAAQNIVIITLGIVLLMHIMNFFKLQVVLVNIPGISLSKVCTSAFYMQDSVQVWDRYVYFIVFGWLPLLILLCFVMILCYQSWMWKRKALIDQPDRFFKDGRSNKTIITLGIVALVCMIPDLVLQSVMMGSIDSFDELPICIHRAMHISRAAFDHRVELMVVIFSVINASIKIWIYMLTSNQFRWTVLYCLHKPFEKPETQPPTKNMFAENFRRKIENFRRNSFRSNNGSGSAAARGASGGQYQNYQNRPPNTTEYYPSNSNQGTPRPYVITGNNSAQAPGLDDVTYYEDQYGSQRLVAPGDGTPQPITPRHNPRGNKTTAAQNKPRPAPSRESRGDPPQRGTPAPHQGYPLGHYPSSRHPHPRHPGHPGQEPKLKWREDRLEPFPKPQGGGATPVTGGPWTGDVMEMVV